MKNYKIIATLSILIVIFSIGATLTGIFSKDGPGEYKYTSIRDQSITIYGKGLYKHMSADVAIQGIAQDYVTLFLAVPLLILALFFSRKNTLKSKLFLAGVLNYFLLTYLFYMNMAMYNAFALLSFSFFAFILTLLEIDIRSISQYFNTKTPVMFVGWFLMILSILIGMLWLSIIVQPLFDGSIIPKAVEHYTTLTVQGFDLSIFLPIAFISGFLLLKKNGYGYFMSSITLVLLSLLMTALVAKIIAMALADVNVIPVVFIIPTFMVLAIISAIVLFKNIKEKSII